jgi:Na+/melibiose symporter-like transporter
MTRPQQIRYFLLAFFLYLIFRHWLGPKMNLEGWMLTISSYGFAVVIATLYLYWILRRAARPPEEKDA